MDSSGVINDYRDLNVWKVSMELAEEIYGITRAFPREEAFGMTSQMRRSASSIPANIAEGFGRQQRQSFIQYLRIAQGSLKELETHCELGRRVGLIKDVDALSVGTKCESLGKMIRAFISKLGEKK